MREPKHKIERTFEIGVDLAEKQVWFQPNRWTHWGEGGFGSLSILLPQGEPEPLVDLPIEIRFLTDLPDSQELGEEITLATLDQIMYQPDRWS